ncbi:DUF805 domain-containing protein [Lysobacter korlensis]|uniref:DUF805 domain-containing protein n=1 Tax=Lysobacter korlensis TaxID=553636 RepID=A0ABV6S0L3_9GAMM
MTFFQAIRTGFRKYADFTGTATRSEFWWWVLFATLASAALTATANAIAGGSTDVNALWSLLMLLPSLAVTVRRLRDAGYGWGHTFWLLLPFAGTIIVAVLCAQPADQRLTAQRAGADLSFAVRS